MRAWALASLASLALAIALGALGAPLTTAAAPNGIVSLELAPTRDAAARILASWDARALRAAWTVQALDLLFPLAYAVWFALSCRLLARRLAPGALARAGAWLGRWIWLAAALDYVENAGIALQLWRGASALGAALTVAGAVPKWGLVCAAAAFLVVAAPAAALARQRPR